MHPCAAMGTPSRSQSSMSAAAGEARLCQDCSVKHASFGTKNDRTRRWCSTCAKNNGHDGAVNLNAKMCEDCNQKMVSFGSQTDRKKRWCGGCVKKHDGHDGAEYLGKRYMCEDCGKKRADWGGWEGPEAPLVWRLRQGPHRGDQHRRHPV